MISEQLNFGAARAFSRPDGVAQGKAFGDHCNWITDKQHNDAESSKKHKRYIETSSSREHFSVGDGGNVTSVSTSTFNGLSWPSTEAGFGLSAELSPPCYNSRNAHQHFRYFEEKVAWNHIAIV